MGVQDSGLLQNLEQVKQAKNLKIHALRALASFESSANGRNYYLTCALEEEGLVLKPHKEQRIQTIMEAPLFLLFKFLPVTLNPERSKDVDTVIGFKFTDNDDSYMVHIRRGVAELQERLEVEADIIVRVSSIVWRKIVAQLKSPVVAYGSGELVIEVGSIAQFASAMSLFDQPP